MFYTSYFFNKKIANSDMLLVSVSRNVPEWYNGKRCTKLAPSWDVLNEYKKTGDEQKYTERYRTEVLSKIDCKEFAKNLNEYANGKDVCFLCYEGKDKFCHRHLIANWFRENGIECEEYGKNELLGKVAEKLDAYIGKAQNLQFNMRPSFDAGHNATELDRATAHFKCKSGIVYMDAQRDIDGNAFVTLSVDEERSEVADEMAERVLRVLETLASYEEDEAEERVYSEEYMDVEDWCSQERWNDDEYGYSVDESVLESKFMNLVRPDWNGRRFVAYEYEEPVAYKKFYNSQLEELELMRKAKYREAEKKVYKLGPPTSKTLMELVQEGKIKARA